LLASADRDVKVSRCGRSASLQTAFTQAPTDSAVQDDVVEPCVLLLDIALHRIGVRARRW
jgi:hypothetical protein